MHILITGSTGLIGSALVDVLRHREHEVSRLVRFPTNMQEATILWNPQQGTIDSAALEGFDAVIHLAGESIAAGRWTADRKARIRDSRVTGTRLLSEALAQLDHPPEVLLCGSATGFYGHREDEVLDEDSCAGEGFLASVAQDWEAAADPAWASGIRTVHLRFGMVLSKRGGALEKMLLPFRMALGGTIGGGSQYWPWVHLDDVVGVVLHALSDPGMVGPVNVVAPQAVTNLDFTQALGWVLRRPTLLPVPRFAIRWVLGEMADELLLASTRVRPARLLAVGYDFHYPELQAALTAVLE